MKWFFLCLALFLPFLGFGNRDEVPALYQGRYRPYGVVSKLQQEEEIKVLPLKTQPGTWVGLSFLEQNSGNFTPYTDRQFQKIRESYKAKDTEALADALNESYAALAGKAFKKSGEKALVYPTRRQLAAELFYCRYPLALIALLGYALAFTAFFFSAVWRKKPFFSLGMGLFLAGFAVHTLMLLLRSYILWRPPVSNMAETLVYVPWAAAAVTLAWRSPFLLFASSLTSTLLLAFSLPMNQGLENVQAVLDSRYWLTVHVLMIVGSYGIFFLSGVLGHFLLLRVLFKKEIPAKLEKLVARTLYLGTALLIPGTILGGVWAAQSWGRFWDWDPKESWAFISSGVYLIGIHGYTAGKIKGVGLAATAVAGLMAISFTWYGVNYILGTGLHSYGFGTGGEWAYLLYLFAEGVFLLVFFCLNKKGGIDKALPF